jgi:hypothetical protein
MKSHAKRHGARNEDQGHEDPEWRDARVRDLVRLHSQSAIAGDSVEFSTERDTLNAVSRRAAALLSPWEIGLTRSLGTSIVLSPQSLKRC